MAVYLLFFKRMFLIGLIGVLEGRASFLLLLLSMSLNTSAATTYSGTNGVRLNLLTSNSVAACSGCHYNGGSAPDFTSAYSAFSAYASASHSGIEINAVQLMIERTSLAPGVSNFMPEGATRQINVAEKALLAAWKANFAVDIDMPTTTTLATISDKDTVFKTTSDSAQFTVYADVDDSGIDVTSYLFQYGLSQTPSFESASQTVDGSGGGTNATEINQSLSSLECGETYYYRIKASNASYLSTLGVWQEEDTPACNTAPVIQNAPFSLANATEDILYQFDVDAIDGENDSIRFSLSDQPAGMSINDASGLISWTPLEGVTSSGVVTVRAHDNGVNTIGADGAVADSETFIITADTVNDAPLITSAPSISAIENVLYSYQVVVNDPDDSGLELSYDVSPKTGDMNISTSGLLTWTPANGVLSSGQVTVRVADNGENSALPAIQTFTITVAEINTSPTITSFAVTTATEDIVYQYAVAVLDSDDANNGADLHFVLSNQPSDMEVSDTGVITWLPLEGQGDVSNIQITVTDGGENSAMAAVETFSIDVASINDAPVFNSVSTQQISELGSLSLNLANLYIDPDDANNGSDLTWSLLTSPSGMLLSATGQLNWTASEGDTGIYNVQVGLADGGENGASNALLNFQVQVALLDLDGDLIADYEDNCEQIANADQADFDQDGLGDLCDSDDDNDTIPDDIELANGLNPFNSADAALDNDGDGIDNAAEYLQCLGFIAEAGSDVGYEECSNILVDSAPPVITTNGDQREISNSYLTSVELLATALDGNDGTVDVNANELGPFRPGKHVVTWQASDLQGNIAESEQQVNILPLVRFSGYQQVISNQTVRIPISLSGTAIAYPVIVDFEVAGTANELDHDLVDGQVIINDGNDGEILFNTITNQNLLSNKSIIVNLMQSSSSVHLPDGLSHQVDLMITNVAPSVELNVTQNSLVSQVIYQDQGSFNIQAVVNDINNDELSIAWTASASEELFNLSENTFSYTFDTSEFPIGFYNLQLAVDDGDLKNTQSIAFRIETNVPILTTIDSDNDGIADNIEGLADTDRDGVQDYLDPINDVQYMHKNLVSNDLFETANQLLVTQSGLVLKIGQLAIEQGQSGVGLLVSELNKISDEEEKNIIGEVFDFEIHGINSQKPQVKIVIPLTTSIPINAEYWKYDGGTWFSFDTRAGDYIATAFKQNGVCPDTSSDQYRSGLVPFTQCLLLAITDGGINDSDGTINGVVKDPGAIVMDSLLVFNPQENLTKPKSSPSVGSVSIGFIFLLLMLISFRVQAEELEHQTLLSSTLGYDDNVSRAEDEVDIIEDRFLHIDARLIIDYALSFNKSISAEAQVGHQAYQFTDQLSRNEYAGRIVYRWQNSFSYNSPWYQVFSDIKVWDTKAQQRDSTFYTQQALVSARITTKISGSLGIEHKVRDSESKIFDLAQNRIFGHLDYAWSDNLAIYSSYSYIKGDTVSTVQSQYCNGLTSISIYPLLVASKDIEWDQAFNDAYCGNWLSYRLNASTHTFVLGGNYGFGHSSSLDFSWLYADVQADGGNYYQRNIVQLNFLKAF